MEKPGQLHAKCNYEQNKTMIILVTKTKEIAFACQPPLQRIVKL